MLIFQGFEGYCIIVSFYCNNIDLSAFLRHDKKYFTKYTKIS
nr:MAG TPA: hypothetical protein [Caudoviricetes sp.]